MKTNIIEHMRGYLEHLSKLEPDAQLTDADITKNLSLTVGQLRDLTKWAEKGVGSTIITDEALHQYNQLAGTRRQLGDANAQVAELYAKMTTYERALIQCDAYLDELACGASSLPPTAHPLQVPKAVEDAVVRLRSLLAQERAKRRVEQQQQTT